MKEVEIYTDGACSGNPGPGGYAAILRFAGTEKEISGGEAETTNNRMELMGPIEALRLLREPCRVTLYSDSAYVVDAFNRGWVYSWEKNGWKRKGGALKNTDLFRTLLALCRQHSVTWVKVRGHADNAYNNRCDALAVAASKEAARDTDTPDARDRAYEGPLGETVTGSREVYRGHVFRVEVLDIVLPDGRTAQREIVRHSGGAAVVALDAQNCIYLVRQYRIAAGREMLEIPAGKLEPGEDPQACALRELREETGMEADASACEKLFSMYATPGYCAEQLHIFRVRGLRCGAPHRDAGEFLHIVRMPFEEAVRMVRAGEICDAKTIAGILAAQADMRCDAPA